MAVNGKSVIGLRVLTINDGKQIETVDDIVYDPSEQKVKALIVNSGGLFSEAKAISIEDVQNIGKDAVMVQSADVIKPVSELTERVSHIAESDNNLVKTRVVTQEGTELGSVTDIVFDPITGAVQELEVSQGGMKNIGTGKKRIKPQDIITVGADATIVSSFTEDKFEEQGQEGGLLGAFNQVKDKTTELGQTAGEKLQETADKARSLPDDPRVKDAVDNVKNKTQEVTDKAKEKGTELKDKAQEKTEEVKNDPNNKEKMDALKDKASSAKDAVVDKTKEAKDSASSNDGGPKVEVKKTTETEIKTP